MEVGKRVIIDDKEEVKSKIKDLCKEKYFFNVEYEGLKGSTLLDKIKIKTFKVKLEIKKKNLEFELGKTYEFSTMREGVLISFETTCLDFSLYSAEFSLPRSIELYEKRLHERYNTAEFANPFVEIEMNGDIFIFRMFDLSQGGLAFIISDEHKDLFSQGQHINLSKIGKQKFASSAEAKISHVSDYIDDDGSALYKVGVQFLDVPDFI